MYIIYAIIWSVAMSILGIWYLILKLQGKKLKKEKDALDKELQEIDSKSYNAGR